MTTQHFSRPDTSAPVAGESGLPNRDKFQVKSATIPKIPIASEDHDSEHNLIVDALNELFDLGTSGVVPDNSVTLAKLAHLTAGSMYFMDGTGVPSELLIGSTDEVLSIAAGIPTWTALSGTPTAVVSIFAGSSVPSGWLICDGSAVSRATFSDLFSTISTTYGIGDGSTTFNVPDLRGRNALGLDNMGGVSADRVTDAQADVLGGTLGAETDTGSGVTIANTTGGHALTINEMPAHDHDYDDDLSSGDAGAPNSGTGQATTATTTSTGGGAAHDHSIPVLSTTVTMTTGANVAPQLSMNYIIKT